MDEGFGPIIKHIDNLEPPNIKEFGYEVETFFIDLSSINIL
jgi:hypothetical protein